MFQSIHLRTPRSKALTNQKSVSSTSNHIMKPLLSCSVDRINYLLIMLIVQRACYYLFLVRPLIVIMLISISVQSMFFCAPNSIDLFHILRTGCWINILNQLYMLHNFKVYHWKEYVCVEFILVSLMHHVTPLSSI